MTVKKAVAEAWLKKSKDDFDAHLKASNLETSRKMSKSLGKFRKVNDKNENSLKKTKLKRKHAQELEVVSQSAALANERAEERADRAFAASNRTGNILVGVGVVFVLALIVTIVVVLVKRSRKKKAEANSMAPGPAAGYGQGPPQVVVQSPYMQQPPMQPQMYPPQGSPYYSGGAPQQQY